MEATAAMPSATNEETRLHDDLEPTSTGIAKNRIHSSTACVACREKHLKCDGLRTCTRCAAQGLKCVYLKSRRGHRSGGLTRGVSAQQVFSSNLSEADMTETADDVDLTASESAEINPSSLAFPSMQSVVGVASSSLDHQLREDSGEPSLLVSGGFRPNHRQRCMEAYFHYFYDAHPFLLPRHHLLQFLKQRPMEHLETAMCFAGSRYVSGASMAFFAHEFEPYLLETKPVPTDASTIQAMLLFALSLDGNNEREKASEILIKAQSLAIELGMNQREYAVLNGRGSMVCEESLRRTWWELYVVSIVLAAFQGSRTLHQLDNFSNVLLPCEEKEFVSGLIPPAHTLDQFDDESFDSDDFMFSSYTYKIAAAQNLDRILQANHIVFPDDPALHRLEAYLTNWHLRLPLDKKDLFDGFGTFDETLFQARMIANLSALILYRHFSPLDGLVSRTITSCTPESAITPVSISESIHTRRAAEAASNVSKLVTLPGPLFKHTHFFVCALTLSSITHLSVWATMAVMAPDQDLKQQILMNEGALKAVAPLWPAAGIGLQQISSVARRIYATRKDAAGEVFWGDFIDNDLLSGLIENNTNY